MPSGDRSACERHAAAAVLVLACAVALGLAVDAPRGGVVVAAAAALLAVGLSTLPLGASVALGRWPGAATRWMTAAGSACIAVAVAATAATAYAA